HGLGEKAFFNPTFFVQNIIAQMAVISPLLWIMILIVFVHCIKKAFTSSDVLNKLFLCFSLPVFVVFGYASLSNEILPHWPAVFYLTLILPSANLVNEWLSGSSRKKKNFIRFSLVVGLFFTLIIPVQIVFKCFPISSEIDPTSDVYGWDIAAGFAEYLCGEIGSDAFLFTHKFYPTGQIAFYLSKDFSEKHLFCLSRRIDQYDFWQKDINLTTYLNGKTGIFFTDEHFKDFPGVMYKFKKIENPFQIDVYHRGKKVKSFFFYKCHDFKTFETDPLYFNSLRFYQRDFFRDLIDIDNRAFISLNKIAAKNKWLANLLFGVGLLGSTEINVLVVSILLYLTRRDKFLKYLGLFVFALLISAVVIHMLKEMFPTSRPVSYFSKEYAVYITGPVLKSGSFPSGHAQTSFLAASFLSWVFPCYSIFFFFLASIISFSRVFSGVHFFRDIIAGGILGFSAFWIVLKLCRFFVSSKCIEKDKIA
ncbi:MAG: phosphatase PAP2 family protein, partial [Candidatus Omnitrophica bacterium]|nr:phosphatase PAP2 family protein [Candidatus Omnitrophota bacterium]